MATYVCTSFVTILYTSNFVTLEKHTKLHHFVIRLSSSKFTVPLISAMTSKYYLEVYMCM